MLVKHVLSTRDMLYSPRLCSISNHGALVGFALFPGEFVFAWRTCSIGVVVASQPGTMLVLWSGKHE